ncbi:carboxypeptidase regulatory-like domain-containing protein [Granulicella sp. dw_53]|uniref:TonB-dependent receptor n=1 Tax=Granulicella sp. dw_53 TaxID=2719792 RepID=UPI001BD6BC23|nr:carboxypeptidase regulatory-like domain-containing protein [Granulicella sp. dw_53]
MFHKISKAIPFSFVLILLLSVCNRSLYAQSSFGQIAGSVTDVSGSVIPGATVTIINVGTQATRTATTDERGAYIFTNLPIGDYSLEISRSGFRGEKRSGIAVTADAHLTSDFGLVVGSATESVTVSAVAGETLNTTSGELARVIDAKQVENLALNGRNYTQLLTLVPGAVVTNPDIFSVTTSLASGNQTINGNRADTGNLTVDGAYNQVAGSNGSLMNNVGPDFIQEVKIDTSNASAEFGRTSGPSFNIVTKSGSNAFHGGAFEFVRNNALDATNFIAKRKTQLVYNDFGFFVGGPIIKDKLFFFVGEEWRRLRQQAIATTFTVPTTAMINGDFSALCTGTNSNGVANTFIGGVCSSTAGQLYVPGTATPILNNNIASRITPDGRALANVYKTITATGLSFRDGGIPSNNLTLAPTNPLNFHQDLVRFDYMISPKHTLYGRWIHDQNTLTDPYGTFSNTGILPTTPTLRNRPGQSYLLSYTWSISPNLINQATANTSWAAQRIPPAGDLWKRETYGFQYNKLYPGAGPYPNGIPIVNITGYAPMQGPNFSLLSPSTDIQVADNMTWLKGNHNFKFGGVYIRDRVDQNARSNYTGTATFNAAPTTSNCRAASGNTTCYALADAFLGNFQQYSEASADPVGHFRFNQVEAFAQDSWKATRQLSLEIGLRWQLISPFYTQGNNISNFDASLYNAAQAVTVRPNGTIDPTSGNPYNGLVRAGDGVPADQAKRVIGVNTALFPLIPAGAPRGLYKMSGAFGPRFGFAYSANSNTVIRGGVGLFYYRPQGNLIFSQLSLPPFLQNTQFDTGNLATIGSGSPNNSALQGTISAIDPINKNPYTWQYSVGLQRQLPKSVLLELNYVGSVAHHQQRQPNVNFPNLAPVVANATGANTISSVNFFNPFKGYTQINSNRFDSNYNYNSLQAFASKRAGIVTFTLAYTYSKALGDSSGNNQTLENWSSLNYNYGYLQNDRRHAFVASFVIQTPDLKGHNFLLREVAGSWQVSGVARLQSGGYFNLQSTSTLGLGNVRPNIIPGVQIYGSGHAGIAGYLNAAASTVSGVAARGAFVPAPRTQAAFGTAPYGAILGPGLAQTDATLSKFFPVTERVRLKFQADFFNVLNRTNFSGVNLNVSNANFGTVSGAYPPRQLQLGAKVNF